MGRKSVNVSNHVGVSLTAGEFLLTGRRTAHARHLQTVNVSQSPPWNFRRTRLFVAGGSLRPSVSDSEIKKAFGDSNDEGGRSVLTGRL